MKVSIELSDTSRHCRDMTENVLKVTLTQTNRISPLSYDRSCNTPYLSTHPYAIKEIKPINYVPYRTNDKLVFWSITFISSR